MAEAALIAAIALRLELEDLWPLAVEDGLVFGSLDAAFDAQLNALAGTADLPAVSLDRINATLRKPVLGITRQGIITEEDLGRMVAWSERTQTDLSTQRVAAWIDDYLRGAGDISRRASTQAWTKDRYVEALERLSVSRGAEGVSGNIVNTWWRTGVVNQGYTFGAQAVAEGEPTRRLYPVAQYTFIDDATLRDSHAIIAAGGLPYLVRPDSPLIDRVRPPRAWNCRCRLTYWQWRRARENLTEAEILLPEPNGPPITRSGVAPALGDFPAG